MKEKIYLECEGRKNNFGLIENFPDVIKSIYIDEIGLLPGYQTDVSLNTESFDESGNTINGLRKDWKCAASIDEIPSEQLISELAKESAIAVITDYLNKQKIIVLEEKTTTKIISSIDVLENINGMMKINIYKTRLENIYNKFVIKYRLDYSSNKFLLVDFLNKDDSSLTEDENIRTGLPNTYTGLCLDSFVRYNKNSEFIIEANHIRERSTAIKLMKWYAEWFTRQRYIIELDLMLNANTIDLELGDQLKLDLDLLPTGISLEKNFIITGLDADYFNGVLNVKLFEISF